MLFVAVAKPITVSQIIQAPRPTLPITVTSSAIRPSSNQVKITLPVNQNTPLVRAFLYDLLSIKFALKTVFTLSYFAF